MDQILPIKTTHGERATWTRRRQQRWLEPEQIRAGQPAPATRSREALQFSDVHIFKGRGVCIPHIFSYSSNIVTSLYLGPSINLKVKHVASTILDWYLQSADDEEDVCALKLSLLLTAISMVCFRYGGFSLIGPTWKRVLWKRERNHAKGWSKIPILQFF